MVELGLTFPESLGGGAVLSLFLAMGLAHPGFVVERASTMYEMALSNSLNHE